MRHRQLLERLLNKLLFKSCIVVFSSPYSKLLQKLVRESIGGTCIELCGGYYEEAWVEKFWGWECAWHFQVSFTFSAGYFSLGCSLPWVCLNVNGGIQVQDKDLASGECVPSVCPPQSWLLSSSPFPLFLFQIAHLSLSLRSVESDTWDPYYISRRDPPP